MCKCMQKNNYNQFLILQFCLLLIIIIKYKNKKAESLIDFPLISDICFLDLCNLLETLHHNEHEESREEAEYNEDTPYSNQ